MMQVLLRAFHIHISGIPFVSECRNTVNTPVDKNSEFISCIPLRYRMLTERIPGIRVWSLCDHLIDQRKVFFFFHFAALFYIFWSFSTDAYMLPSNFLVVYVQQFTNKAFRFCAIYTFLKMKNTPTIFLFEHHRSIFCFFRYSLRSPFRSVSSLLLRSLWYAYLCIPHNTSEEGYAPVR